MIETERRFLITEVPNLSGCMHYHVKQGYLVIDDIRKTVVRIREDMVHGRILAVKNGSGLARQEVEMPISVEHFAAMWPMTQGQRIEKVRHLVILSTGLTAEVDLFIGRHSGLQIVEVEFKSVGDAEKFQPPHWFGEEVTHDIRYVNAVMARDGLPE